MMLSRTSFAQARLVRSLPGKTQGGGLVNNHVFAGQCKFVVRWNTSTQSQAGPLKVTAEQIQGSSQSGWKNWSTRFRRLAKTIKYIRIPALMVSVYALGRQQGIIECSRNPRLVEDELLQAILADVGVRDREQVQIFTSEDAPIVLPGVSSLQAKTIRIGNDIIRVASLYVREKIVESVNKVKEKVPSDIPNEQLVKLCHQDEDFQFWTTALYRVEGEDPYVPWRYVIIDSPIANAFVSEILPQRFFITTKMFKDYIANEDELAVILGHEMSHLILGHVSQRNTLETMLRTCEVLLLSIDPTEGLVSLGVIGGLAWMRGVLIASFSREHETEADTLGLQLAAMACYDTKKGSLVMKKMHDHQVRLAGEHSRNSHLLQLMDTHPPSLDRYIKILEQSEVENASKYERCASVRKRMAQALWG